MTPITDIKISTTHAAGNKPTKEELLRLIYALDPRHSFPKTREGARRTPLAGLGKRFSLARQSRITRDLLRRYFVLQVAQIAGNAG